MSAHLLPHTLGRRIRSTLLVTSTEGTASIIDIERGRVLHTFPSHDYSLLSSFATKLAQNLLALTYIDGVRREWDMSTEDSGVLINPSRPSKTGENTAPSALTPDWTVTHIDPAKSAQIDKALDEDDGTEPNGDGTLAVVESFARAGIPTAAIDVRVVLAHLDAATTAAQTNRRPAERRVNVIHPGFVAAKALLTALAPGGIDDFFNGSDSEYRHDLEALLFRRRRPATMGQIGAGQNVSMLAPTTSLATSPTVTTIKLVTTMSLVRAMLICLNKPELTDPLLLDVIAAHASTPLALGVFAKFWSDTNIHLRHTARLCLHTTTHPPTPATLQNLTTYWAPYLPTLVPQELSSTKEVARSVILLTSLLPQLPPDLKKQTSLSASLLLHESTPLYQDTALELLGAFFEAYAAHIDAFDVLTFLLRLSLPAPRDATLQRCLLLIATANTPLFSAAVADVLADAPRDTLTFVLASCSLMLPVLLPGLLRTWEPVLLEALSKRGECCYSPTAKKVAVLGKGVVEVFSQGGGVVVCENAGEFGRVGFSPEGTRVVVVGGGEVRVWKVHGGGFLEMVVGATTGEEGRRRVSCLGVWGCTGDGEVRWRGEREVCVGRESWSV